MSIINFASAHPLASSDVAVYSPLISALIASSVTIVGIFLNNRFALKHKKMEQEHAIKKEIFLEFSQFFSESLAMLQAFSNSAVNMQESLNKYNEGVGVVGKMYIVAEPELLLEVRALIAEIEDYGSELATLRLGLDKIRLNAENFKLERLEILKALGDLNSYRLSLAREGRVPEGQAAHGIEWEHNFKMEKLAEINKKIYEVEVEAYQAELALIELGLIATHRLEEKSLSGLSLIKEQLRVRHDATNYENEVKAQNMKRIEASRRLLEARRAAIRVPDEKL